MTNGGTEGLDSLCKGHVWRKPGQTDRLVLCFSSVGTDSGEPPPPEWRRRMERRVPQDHLLYLADPTRSWLNRPGLIEQMVDAIQSEAARSGAKRICAIGISMGAFSAMVLAGFTRIDVVVAHSPQYSVDPALVPDEQRWRKFVDAITTFRIRSVADHLQPHCQYFVFLSRHGRELPQRRLIRAQSNLDLYLMSPQAYHNTHLTMRSAGVLDRVTEACFSLKRDQVCDIMEETFGCKPQPVPKLDTG